MQEPMVRAAVVACVLCMLCATLHLGHAQEQALVTSLDNPFFVAAFRLIRVGFTNLFGRGPINSRAISDARAKGMFQEIIPSSVQFPCKTKGFRSASPPSSVHKLRPGDIDVVAAMGDSLTAAAGLTATRPLEILVEHRGKSWSIGGQADWRTYLTLPNILKEFNPNLIGWSRDTSTPLEDASQFNVAESGAMSADMPYMASVLVKRIKADPRVDVKHHWKLITHMIGGNDFCLNMCYYTQPEVSIDKHRQDLLKVLRTLRDNLPRTIVNLVPPPHLRTLAEMTGKPGECYYIHKVECPCLFGSKYLKYLQRYYKVMRAWQRVDEEISKMPEFHTNDFTIVFQPFSEQMEIPKNSRNITDFSNMSYDCFHPSQKFNAAAANSLWNNMLEPEGGKAKQGSPLFQRFLCPTEEHPYIYTQLNSAPRRAPPKDTPVVRYNNSN